MSFEVTVLYDHKKEKFYFKLETPFNYCGVYTHYKQDDILRNKDNKQFFFDAIFDPNLDNKSPDEVRADDLNKPMITVTALLKENSEINAVYDVMLSVHENQKTGNRVMFMDFPDRKMIDKREFMSGRNIYIVPDDYEITKNTFEDMFHNNSHKDSGNRLAPIVQNDKLANEEDYFVVDHKSYSFFFL